MSKKCGYNSHCFIINYNADCLFTDNLIDLPCKRKPGLPLEVRRSKGTLSDDVVVVVTVGCRGYSWRSGLSDAAVVVVTVGVVVYRMTWLSWLQLVVVVTVGVSTSQPDHLKFLFELSDAFAILPTFLVLPVVGFALQTQVPGIRVDPTQVRSLGCRGHRGRRGDACSVPYFT